MKKTLTPVLPENPAIAFIDTAYKAADKAITDAATTLTTRVTAEEKATTDNKTAQDAVIAAVKATADKAKTDLVALTGRVSALESPSTNNASYILSGSPFVAAVAIGLRSLVHVKADGKIEPADDTVQGKEANGIIDAPIVAGASGNVYGTGARFSAIGLSGTQPGSQLFAGSAGLISLSSSGNGRFIQQVGIFKSSLYFFDFSDAGYWLEAL